MLFFEIESGEVKRLSIDGESISMSDYSADSDFIEKFRDDYIAVRNFTNKKVGVLMNDISTRDSYFGSSAFIDMIHTLTTGYYRCPGIICCTTCF